MSGLFEPSCSERMVVLCAKCPECETWKACKQKPYQSLVNADLEEIIMRLHQHATTKKHPFKWSQAYMIEYQVWSDEKRSHRQYKAPVPIPHFEDSASESCSGDESSPANPAWASEVHVQPPPKRRRRSAVQLTDVERLNQKRMAISRVSNRLLNIVDDCHEFSQRLQTLAHRVDEVYHMIDDHIEKFSDAEDIDQ